MKSKRFTKWMIGAFIILLLFGAARLYYALTDDFRLSNMTYELDFEAPWQVPILSANEQQQFANLLQQKYYYIGKGAQCYAFASADHQYVLKFFKFKHLKPHWFIQFVPSVWPFAGYKADYIERKRRKLMGVFEGYDLAYRENRKESELLYLHLLPTHSLGMQATVVDKIGFEHQINLDDVVFLIQKKGETLRSRLHRLLKQGQQEAAKSAISSILTMYMKEYQKGVYDRDHGVMHNTGFVGDQPFHLDVGKFTKENRMKEHEFYAKDLEHIVWKIDTWIKSNYPDHYPALSEHLASEYNTWTGQTFDPASIDPERFKKKRHALAWRN